MTYFNFHGHGSEVWPDKVIRDRYFPDYDYRGIYLDVGAAGPVTMSNSYHFRMNGWEIIAVEPNPNFCKEHRDMGFDVVECAVAETSASLAPFTICTQIPASGSALGDESRDWAAEWEGYSNDVPLLVSTPKRVIPVPVLTLNKVLGLYPEVKSIDVLDLDVELGELAALRGFDLNRYKPKLCLIEDHNPSKSGLNAYLEEQGYRLDYRAANDSYYVRRAQ